ncbi:hypothetical protein QSV37_08270 [Acinetobacter sp. VNK23]|nr:hypothetical protein [Acinetobacter thutiue]MDM1020299.1 hypothetical protein [Acinetobacter thutiue]
MIQVMKYIPDLDQEEETLITAKIDTAIEKLRKRKNERILSYIEKGSSTYLKIQIETSVKS